MSTQMNWTVTDSDPTVLVPVPAAQDEQGRWQATLPGQSTISADGRPMCNPGQACPQFIVHFQATVNVVDGASPSGGVAPPAG